MSSTGEPSNGGPGYPSLSSDGRYLAFSSGASNLVSNDTNATGDVFVRDIAQGVTTRISVSSAGEQGNSNSFSTAISADGRYVAFDSNASNLVAYDTNNQRDIFVHDRSTHTTTRVSVDSAGNELTGGTDWVASISADGRYVAFTSGASNVVPFDTNNAEDVFVHDRNTGITSCVSLDSISKKPRGGWFPSISADGRFVAFISYDDPRERIYVHDRNTGTTTLVSVDGNGNPLDGDSYHPSISGDGRFVTFDIWRYSLNRVDIFVHDRSTAKSVRVNVNSAGTLANASSERPHISGDGRYVTFISGATNLASGDTNDSWDFFVHDRKTAKTRRLSLDSQGGEANDGTDEENAISADGRYVAFLSPATNLVPNDLNGQWDAFVRAVPYPVVDSITPNKLPIGATTTITVRGSDFLKGINISVDGATLSKMIVWNENVITAEATVSPTQAIGARNVTASLLGTGAGPLTGAVGQCVKCVTIF